MFEIRWGLFVEFAIGTFVFVLILYAVIPKLKYETRSRATKIMDNFEDVFDRSKMPLFLLGSFIILDSIVRIIAEVLIESENVILMAMALIYKTGWFPIIYIFLSSWMLKQRKKKTGKDISALYIDIAFIFSILFCFIAGIHEEGLLMLAILAGHFLWFDGIDTSEIEKIKDDIKVEKRRAIVAFIIVGIVCIFLGKWLLGLADDIRISATLGMAISMLCSTAFIYIDPLNRLPKSQDDGAEDTKGRR